MSSVFFSIKKCKKSHVTILIFNEPKRTHITHLFINLHWLPIAARIQFKALMFAYKTTPGSAPLYLNSLLQTYMPSRSLRSASERRITVPSQRGTKSLSQTFSWTVPIWWNDLPNSIRAAESLPIFKKRLKNTSLPSLFGPLTQALSILILLSICLLFIKKKPHTHLTLYQLHASFSWKANTIDLFFSILSTCFLYIYKKALGFFFLYSIYSFLKKKKKTFCMYCVRPTETCHNSCWFWLLLMSSFVSRIG